MRLLPVLLCLLAAAPATGLQPVLTVETHPVPPGSARLVPDPDAVLLEAGLPSAGVQPPAASGLVSAREESPAAIRQEKSTTWEWTADSGSLEDFGPGQVRWYGRSTGEPARVTVRLTTTEAAEMTETSVVLIPGVPFDPSGAGVIGSTIIGIYPNQFASNVPAPVARNRAAYTPPESFYRIDERTAEAPLPGGATLGSLNPPVFGDGGERFVAVDERLLRFWSHFAAALQANNFDPADIRVLRGYVSPYERQRLESMGIRLAEFTRFQYGDSLALILDANGDGRMDDLNADDTADIADADILAEAVALGLEDAGLSGGIGTGASFGGPDNIGTPYVQVDTRGVSVRWRED